MTLAHSTCTSSFGTKPNHVGPGIRQAIARVKKSGVGERFQRSTTDVFEPTHNLNHFGLLTGVRYRVYDLLEINASAFQSHKKPAANAANGLRPS
jgi:hypothetical protein